MKRSPLDHLVLPVPFELQYLVKLLLQLPKRVPAKSFSVGLVWSSVDGRHPDKAHKVDGDRGAEVCSSTPQTAGTSTLVALQPPLVAWDPRCQVSFLALGSR